MTIHINTGRIIQCLHDLIINLKLNLLSSITSILKLPITPSQDNQNI